MYMFQQLRLFAYNQLLSKKVSSTKIDDVEGKNAPQNSKNNVLQEISANLEESERILLEKSTTSCREIKSKSDTEIRDSSKTLVLNTAKKCISLSDLKRHIACINIKKFTRSQKKDIMKPNIICSSGESEKIYESTKSRHQRRHKHMATDESPSSCDLFGYYKKRRRKNISPYEVYVQSVKPVISKNFNKVKKCGSNVFRHERTAKHIPFPSSHHALKVITSNHATIKVAGNHQDDMFDSLQRFKEKRRVSSLRKDHSVNVACGNVSADQSIKLSKLHTQNLPSEKEFGCSPIPCPPKCKCMHTPSQSPMEEVDRSTIAEIDNATQTLTCKNSYRTRPFSCFLPKPYKKSVQYISNLHISNPDPKSIVKCILICLVVTVWSPILLAIGTGWLISYPLRPCIIRERNLQYKRKELRKCKSPSIFHKPRLTEQQYNKEQSCERQNQKQIPYTRRTPCCYRRRDLGKNYSVFHADFRTKPPHTSPNTIMKIFNGVFCSSDKIHQSNVSSFRARRNRVALKNNTLKEPTFNDKRTRHPSIEFSPRPLHSSQAKKVYSIQELDTTTQPTRKSVNLQTHDYQVKSEDEIKWSTFFSPFMKLVENYLVHSKYTTPRPQTFLKKSTDGRGLESKQPEWQCFQRPTIIFSKNLRSQPRHSRGPNKRMEPPQCLSMLLCRKQKVIDSADELIENTETSKLRNKNTNIDILNQQIKRKNLFWKVYQIENKAETNFDKSTQKPVGHCKHIALDSPRCQNPHIERDKCCSCGKIYNTIKTNASIGSDQELLPSDSSQKQSHKLTKSSSTSKYPSGDVECACGHWRKANATVGTNQKSNSNCSCQCHLMKPPKVKPLIECKCKAITENTKKVICHCHKVKNANAAVKKEQKSKSKCSCECHLIKYNKVSPAGTVVCKCPISRNSENLDHNSQKTKIANAAVETDKKSKSNISCQCQLIKPTDLAPIGSCNCKYCIRGNSENLGPNSQKIKKANAAVETDKKSKSNTSCQCHLIKPTDLAPIGSLTCKCPISDNSENLGHNSQNMKKANVAVETDKKSKSNTSCQCHLLKPTQLPPDGSYVCQCPSIANNESLCHNCQKKKRAIKAVKMEGQYSDFCSSCECPLSKHKIKLSGDGSQETKPAFGSVTKSKFSCSCERMELNNVPYNFVHNPFQRDALNVYKLSPISGDTDSQKTKKQQKHQNIKTATNKCIHTPEYVNVCSEVCDNLRKRKDIAHSLSNNNETCRINRQKRTSKCKPNSPKNTKNINKCIRKPIEAKQLKNLKSPFNDTECSGQYVTVGCLRPNCKIRGLNELESNTDKVTKDSWTTSYQNASTTVKTRDNKQCELKKETQSVDKPIHTKKTKIYADKSQICPCLPSEQTTFSIEERKSCSSQTFKKATFATPYSLKYNEQTCNRSKPTRAKYMVHTFLNIVMGKNRRKQSHKEPFQTMQPSGILIKKSDCKKQNYDTESHKFYGGSFEPKPKTINTALFPINTSSKVGNLKTDRCKNYKNKSMEFNYFTMLKDLIDSKTLQHCNFCAQYDKTNSQQLKKNSPCNNMPEMQQQRACPLQHSVIKKCKYPIQSMDAKPRLTLSCSRERGVSGIKQQQKYFSPHNSNIRETNLRQGYSSQTDDKLNVMCSTNTPNTCKPRVSSKRNKNIHLKLSGLRCSIIPETKKALKKAKLSCGRISGKGDCRSNKPGYLSKPSVPAMVTGKGDNALSFNDKRDIIKMCMKHKVKVTPSLVKCLSDSFNVVNQRKHFPRIIEHIKYDKFRKPKKRHRIKLERTGTEIGNATGIKNDCACIENINKPLRHDNTKSGYRKRMGEAEHKKKKRKKTRKKKLPHSSKIHHKKIPERKSFWVQHSPDKKPVSKKTVKKIKHKKKTVKSSRKQASTYSGGGDEIQCSNLYIATLRKRPWFWIYKLMPKCYPSFLRFRLCSKTICTQCAFSLTCCLWAPIVGLCLVCYELFRLIQ